MVSIREMVQHALGITDEEHEQMTKWQEKQKEDRQRAKEETVFGAARGEFGRNIQDMGEKMQQMDMQAQLMAQRDSEMDDAVAADRSTQRKRDQNKSSRKMRYVAPERQEQEDDIDLER